MKIINTLVAIFAFSSSAMASEGLSMFENIDAASAVASHGSNPGYSYSEGTSILDDAAQIARIETLLAPVSVGDIDFFYSADSAVGSLFDAE